MPRKPKAINALSAGERAALYEAELEKKQQLLRGAVPDDGGEAAAPAFADEKAVGSNVGGAEVSVKREAVKKKLPMPEHATVRVDLSVPVGEIKPMHGMCNGPVSYGADISGLFREIGVPEVRFDCTDTAMSAFAVDVSRIFKNFDADPSDPENYDFSVTDKYVEAAYLSGARVLYRLGESVDLFGCGVPRDLDAETLARVCVNILRHYNDGWARGYYYDMDRFELLSFGEDRRNDDNLEIFEKYRRLAGAIKLYDEKIKVGGMSFEGFDGDVRDFLRFCKKNRVSLDFVSVDCFCGDVRTVADKARALVRYARTLGFAELEVILGKWSFADPDALGDADLKSALIGNGEKHGLMRKELFKSQRSVKGAAFAAAFMLEMGGVEGVASGYFYDSQPMVSPFCAIADRFGEPEKPFYVFKTFGELYRARTAVLCEVEEQEKFAHTGIYATAAVSESGEGFVMIASFGGCGVVDLRLDGMPDNVYTAEVYMLDGVKNMEKCDSVPLSGMKKRLLLNVSRYGVIFVKIY